MMRDRKLVQAFQIEPMSPKPDACNFARSLQILKPDLRDATIHQLHVECASLSQITCRRDQRHRSAFHVFVVDATGHMHGRVLGHPVIDL